MHRSSCWARPISPEQSGITGTRKLTSRKQWQHRDDADRPSFRRPTSVFLNTIRLKFCKRYSCLPCCHVLKPPVIRWIFLTFWWCAWYMKVRARAGRVCTSAPHQHLAQCRSSPGAMGTHWPVLRQLVWAYTYPNNQHLGGFLAV